jgi:hypothetical protein
MRLDVIPHDEGASTLMSDLKAQQLAHLSKEIKLDAVQPVIKKAKRSIAELSAATTAAQTVSETKKVFFLLTPPQRVRMFIEKHWVVHWLGASCPRLRFAKRRLIC